MKFCKDCKWYVERKSLWCIGRLCASPRNPDIVTGQPKLEPCGKMRNYSTLYCTESAIWFEEKETGK